MNKPDRRNLLKKLSVIVAGISIAPLKAFSTSTTAFNNTGIKTPLNSSLLNETTMKPGAFSMSLAVKDLQASKEFYEHLGFHVFGGDMKSNYLIMKNGNALIGLFYGMFTNNILTFNPGWDENAKKMDSFDDVRVIQQHLKKKGIKLESEADEKTTGPASFVIRDPDGNMILFDQHV
jgi:catechol 2,3-dioxygenase-like lactoylglutathione lyase family enzyme